MNRVLIGAAVGLAVVVVALVNVQRVFADPAIVIKNDGGCGMPGSTEEGDMIFGGVGLRTTVVENDDKVMLKCRGTGITNESGLGQSWEGFTCGVITADDALVITDDTHATVSASGVSTLTCTYRK